jgi:hypothetical protein
MENGGQDIANNLQQERVEKMGIRFDQKAVCVGDQGSLAR